MVGIERGKVVKLASNADVWKSTNGINIGTTKAVVEDTLVDEYGLGTYFFDDDSYLARFYYDEHLDDQIAIIELTASDIEYELYPRKDDEVVPDIEKQIFDLANAHRLHFGLKPFKWDEKAASAARKHSQDMAERNFFNHYNPDGESPFDRMTKEGINFFGAAENIAAGYFNSLDVHMGWMNSKTGHRTSILSNLERLGVGLAFSVREDRKYSTYFTQKFYTPSPR